MCHVHLHVSGLGRGNETDAHDEAKDIWQFLYQELQDTVLHSSTASSDDDEAESEEEH
jgi:uncharacterized protein (DUF849 family)